MHEDGTRCLKDSECARKRFNGNVPVCLSVATCTGDFKLALNDKRLCVEDCPSWTVDETTGEQRCIAQCPDGTKFKDGVCVAMCGKNQEASGSRCVCTLGHLLSAAGDGCVAPGEEGCRRMVEEGCDAVCLQDNVCPAPLRLSAD